MAQKIVPHLSVTPAAEAIEFYKRAFGFEEVGRLHMMGKVGHAELRLGDMVLFLADEFPGMGGSQSPKTLGGTTVTIHLDSPDVDKAYDRAIKAGATALMPPADMFWGDRYGKLQDPFGHQWSIATHKEDVPPEDMQRRMDEAMKNWKK
jgi:PhnB protein